MEGWNHDTLRRIRAGHARASSADCAMPSVTEAVRGLYAEASFCTHGPGVYVRTARLLGRPEAFEAVAMRTLAQLLHGKPERVETLLLACDNPPRQEDEARETVPIDRIITSVPGELSGLVSQAGIVLQSVEFLYERCEPERHAFSNALPPDPFDLPLVNIGDKDGHECLMTDERSLLGFGSLFGTARMIGLMLDFAAARSADRVVLETSAGSVGVAPRSVQLDLVLPTSPAYVLS